MSLIKGVLGGVKSIFLGKGSLVTLIDIDDKAERRAAEGARWGFLLLGGGVAAWLLLKGLAAVLLALRSG